jgi:glycosyltransferase involved in cell wall biosynthesis
MPNPSLSDLPPPPSGKSGWPWVEETPQPTAGMADGSPWPRVSVITPSYNQAPFIEETIRSVLLQGYPDLEYIVIDGGSTDESVEIIKKYEPWLAYWTSEPDRGQSHAINKGLRRGKGQVVAYLNSDDIYLYGAMQQAVTYIMDQKEADIVYGDCRIINDESHTVSVWRSHPFDLFVELCQDFIYQPTVFIKRRVLEVVGYLDEELHYAMDVDYWLRAAMEVKFAYLPVELAAFRMSEGSKTGTGPLPFAVERRRALDKFFRSHVDSRVAKWRGKVLAWNHYHAGSRLYVEQERFLARREFIKGIKLEPFSLKSIAALLAIFDSHARTNLFGRLASGLPIHLKPLRRHKAEE